MSRRNQLLRKTAVNHVWKGAFVSTISLAVAAFSWVSGSANIHWLYLFFMLLFLLPLVLPSWSWFIGCILPVILLTASVACVVGYDEYFVDFDDKNGPGYAIGLAILILPCAAAWAGVASSLFVKLSWYGHRTLRPGKSDP